MPPAISTQRDMRWVSLYVLCTGMLMIVLDITVMNVTLPSIQRDLGFSQASLAWVINAYLIAFAGLLLLSGRLGDLVGGKRVFLWGLALFTASSFACGIAQSGFALVAARFVQGAGAAMASAVILAVIVTTFTDPGERTGAIGVFSFTASAGGAIGLLLGGIITHSYWLALGISRQRAGRYCCNPHRPAHRRSTTGHRIARGRRFYQRVHDYRIADARRLCGRADSQEQHYTRR